jgi:hypothetical protein
MFEPSVFFYRGLKGNAAFSQGNASFLMAADSPAPASERRYGREEKKKPEQPAPALKMGTLASNL